MRELQTPAVERIVAKSQVAGLKLAAFYKSLVRAPLWRIYLVCPHLSNRARANVESTATLHTKFASVADFDPCLHDRRGLLVGRLASAVYEGFFIFNVQLVTALVTGPKNHGGHAGIVGTPVVCTARRLLFVPRKFT